MIFDHDSKYGLEVPAAVPSLNVVPLRTSFESPWQNGIAERWVESCRRDVLDHVITLNEGHLKRLLSEYIRYYHKDRTHLGLGKETPAGRTRCTTSGPIIAYERIGGLHRRYDSGGVTKGVVPKKLHAQGSSFRDRGLEGILSVTVAASPRTFRNRENRVVFGHA